MKRFVCRLLLLALAVSASLRADDPNAPDVLTNQSWKNDPQFARDVFTFIRLRPQDHVKWWTDRPDSDTNFPFRLHQLTSLRVDTDSRVLDIGNPELLDYPFCYIVEPGFMHLNDREAKFLRGYLLNGGCLVLDDFWGPAEWQNVSENMKLIFPDREPEELELDHPIFHTVFDLKVKPQIPAIDYALEGRTTGVFWEQGARGAHYYAIYDDKRRIMVVICRDTDLGDGWEREGVDEWFFHEFSEKLGYPMGINIVTYLLTH